MATPEPTTRPPQAILRLVSWSLLALASGLMAVYALLLLRFGETLLEFDVDLPALVAWPLANRSGSAAALLVWWLALVAKEFTALPRWLTIFVNAFTVTIVAGLAYGMVHAWYSLMESLS